ncbi:hypothetical protein EYF80_035974 [Liparis tanakae]|uniref:Uncharacterized protein n=1 Tax=Liparis tanakae TaxID=230148 RepID=A0A4Z2GKK0_9TELE|nr:hypothetical protein EYF80_035974 [Liparis tanakae]
MAEVVGNMLALPSYALISKSGGLAFSTSPCLWFVHIPSQPSGMRRSLALSKQSIRNGDAAEKLLAVRVGRQQVDRDL